MVYSVRDKEHVAVGYIFSIGGAITTRQILEDAQIDLGTYADLVIKYNAHLDNGREYYISNEENRFRIESSPLLYFKTRGEAMAFGNSEELLPYLIMIKLIE